MRAEPKGFDRSGEEERDLARGAFRDCKTTLGTGVEEEHCRAITNLRATIQAF